MDLPGRRYLCAGCRTAVLICSRCDRGQRYCTGCAGEARRRSVRAAGRRYQASLRGRHAHAKRQQRMGPNGAALPSIAESDASGFPTPGLC